MASESVNFKGILDSLLRLQADRLEQICERTAVCVRKLTPDQLWARHTDNENAVGNLVLHITGSIRQWLLVGVGNQQHSRDRDAEFGARRASAVADPQEMLAQLQTVADQAVALIRSIRAEDLAEPVTALRNHPTVLEAILHVVEHCSGHAGQIVYATKFLTGEDLGFYTQTRAAQARQK
jgi:uncharacterized damage-inducible protein DinB